MRFLAVAALLLLAVTTHYMLLSLLLMFVSALLTRMLDRSWKNLFYMVKLLRWFIAPILVLHLFFSHGQLIFPATVLPFTWHGLKQGIWLSVHLSAVFLVAMVMFRALKLSEWHVLVRSLPRYGERMSVYMLMITPMRVQIGDGLKQLKMQWQLRRRWKDVPLLLLAAFRFSLSGSTAYAQVLWLRWPESVDATLLCGEGAASARQNLLINLGCLAVLLLACGLMFI